MKRHLPPLGALRAFEAAVRHASFANAADELGVTPGAVSHQIKILEQWLGRPLFDRHPNGVLLTKIGRELGPQLSAAFDQLATVSRRALSEGARKKVSIRAQFSFATEWLSPRLEAFKAAHPDVTLELEARPQKAGDAASECDVKIYDLAQGCRGFTRDKLLQGRFGVVASPLLMPERRQYDPQELLAFPLVHNRFITGSSNDATWERWFAASGMPLSQAADYAYSFNLMHLAAAACLRGSGVALLNTAFILDELERGDLFLLSDIQLDASEAHWMFTSEASLARSEVVAFRSWIIAEAERSTSRCEELMPPSSDRDGG